MKLKKSCIFWYAERGIEAMSILVTGGTGYIGSHTCVELLNAGYDVVVADNYYNSKPEVLKRIHTITGKDVTFYNCDIRDAEGLSRIFEAHNIESVIHFAGLKAVGESCREPLNYFDNNVYGSIVLLQVMQKYNVKKIVFSSSATVYGDGVSPLREEMAIGNVSNPYGRTKVMIEHMLNDLYASDSQWNIVKLRYFNPIGAHKSGLIGEDPNGIPNNLMPYISRVAVGKLPELTVFGNDYDTPDGTCLRDYIHVVDLARGHINAVEKTLNGTGLFVYNLGTGEGYSVLDVLNAFMKVTGVNVPYRIGARRAGDLPAVYSDPTKAKEELGWVAEYGIEDMCADSWRWQSQNPDGYGN